MKKRIIYVVFMLALLLCSRSVFACSSKGTQGACEYDNNCVWLNNDNKCVDKNWWISAGNFFSGASASNMEALEGLTTMVKVVGNMIFIVVTTILGVKYIWGGVESKASVKDSLITLVVSAIFFYGYTSIENLLISGNNLTMIDNTNYITTARKVYSTILYICNFLAVGGLVYIGISYMMAGAEGKASFKAKGVPIALGIIMVYATITFLNFIVSVV